MIIAQSFQELEAKKASQSNSGNLWAAGSFVPEYFKTSGG